MLHTLKRHLGDVLMFPVHRGMAVILQDFPTEREPLPLVMQEVCEY